MRSPKSLAFVVLMMICLVGMLGLTGCFGGGSDGGGGSPVAPAVTGNTVSGKIVLPANATDSMVANVVADADAGVRAAVALTNMKVRLHTHDSLTTIKEANVQATAGTFGFTEVPNGTKYRLSLIGSNSKILLQYFVDELANNAGLKDITINASSTAVALIVEKSGFLRKASEFYQNGAVIGSLTSVIVDVEDWLRGLATGSTDVNTALFGMTGFQAKVTQILAEMPTVGTSTNTISGGDVVLDGIISDTEAGNASIRAAIHGAIVASATVTASVFDGKTETILATGTTDATGTYRLVRLPRGMKNLIIRALKDGRKYGVIVPALPEVTDSVAKAMAPVITRTTINQVTLIEFVAKTDVAIRDVNLADMMNLVSPESMGKLSADELQKLGTNLADREKARQAAKTQFGVDETLFRAFNAYSQRLAQEIQEGIARGDPQYTSDAWEKLYPQKLQAKALELGLPADALMAMQNIDKNMFGIQVQQTLTGNSLVKEQLDKNLAVKKYSDLFASLLQSIKDLETVSFSEISGLERAFAQIIDDLQKVKPVDMAAYLSSHPAAMMIPALMKKALEPLGLLTGTTLVGLLPKDADFTSLSWDPSRKTTPTPDQVVAFEKKMRDVMFANIRANAALLGKLGSDKKIGALLFLLIGPRELGFDPKSLVSGAVAASGSPTVMSNQIMGIVQSVSPAKLINGQTYGFSIKPPTGFPAGPKEWNGLLGFLRADTGLTLAVSGSEDVKDSFLVTVDLEAAPLANQAPAFKARAVAKNTASQTVSFTTATKFQGMLFLKNNEYYLGAPEDSAVARPFAKVTFKDEAMKTQAAIMINRMVQGEAQVTPPTTATGIPTFNVTFITVSTGSIAPIPGTTATPAVMLSLVKGTLVKSGTEFAIASGTLNEANQWKTLPDKLVVKWAANATASPSFETAVDRMVLLAGEIKLENAVKVLHVQHLQFDTTVVAVPTGPTFPIPPGAGLPNGPLFFLGRVINDPPTATTTWKLTDSYRIENNRWVKMSQGMTLIDTTNIMPTFRDKLAVVAGNWKDVANSVFTVNAIHEPNNVGSGTATPTTTLPAFPPRDASATFLIGTWKTVRESKSPQELAILVDTLPNSFGQVTTIVFGDTQASSTSYQSTPTADGKRVSNETVFQQASSTWTFSGQTLYFAKGTAISTHTVTVNPDGTLLVVWADGYRELWKKVVLATNPVVQPLASQTIFGIWFVKQDSPRKPAAPNFFDRLDVTNNGIRRKDIVKEVDVSSFSAANGLQFFGDKQAKQIVNNATQITWEIANDYLQEWQGDVGSGVAIILTKNATTIHGGPVTKEADGRYMINKGGVAQAYLVSTSLNLEPLVGKTIEIPEASWATQPTTQVIGVLNLIRAFALN